MSDLRELALMGAAFPIIAYMPPRQDFSDVWTTEPNIPKSKPNPKKAKHRAKVKAARKQRSKA